MRNKIEVGSEVVFLYDYNLQRATVLKVNKKTYKLDVPAQGFNIPYQKNVNIEKVVHIKDEFAMVWNTNKRHGTPGKYRFDYETYPTENKTWQHWHQAYTYIVERT